MQQLFVALLMELLSAVISIAVGYYAFKGYRASSAKGLLFLYFGFILLGIGMLLRVVTTTYIIVLRVSETAVPSLGAIIGFAGLVYTLTQLVAYSLVVLTYVQQAYELGKEKLVFAAFPFLYISFFNPQLELIALILLGYVTVQSLINLGIRKNSDALLVFLGFAFMSISHLFFLFMVVDEVLILYGQITQLLGFLCLLFMLARVSKGR